MKEILFFSNNKNKIKEILVLFKGIPNKIITLNDFKRISSPQETGHSFEDNARIKSTYGFLKFNKICFADDSGICIEALKGQPGVNSKDFLNSLKSKDSLFNKIITAASNKKNYLAYFQTSICLTISNDTSLIFNGRINGTISTQIRGLDGFGYDPIFIPKGYKNTFAQMSIEEKNKVSHRAVAIKKLKKYLISI